MSALYPQVPCQQPEEEDDRDGSASGSDSVIPSTSATAEANQASSVSLSTPRPSLVPKGKRQQQQTSKVDDALLKLLEQQASGTQRFCQQIDKALSSSRNPRTAFSQWIAAETECLPDPMFRQFQKEVFASGMIYRDRAAQPPQQPQLLAVPLDMIQPSGTPTPLTSMSYPLPSMSYPHPPHPNSAPQSVSMAWQQPTLLNSEVSTQDWSQPSSLNLSGLSGLSPFASVTNASTSIHTANTTETLPSDTGAQVVRSNWIMQRDDLLDE